MARTRLLHDIEHHKQTYQLALIQSQSNHSSGQHLQTKLIETIDTQLAMAEVGDHPSADSDNGDATASATKFSIGLTSLQAVYACAGELPPVLRFHMIFGPDPVTVT